MCAVVNDKINEDMYLAALFRSYSISIYIRKVKKQTLKSRLLHIGHLLRTLTKPSNILKVPSKNKVSYHGG